MSGKKDMNTELRLAEDKAEVIEMAGAETDEQKTLAVAQARLIGDID